MRRFWPLFLLLSTAADGAVTFEDSCGAAHSAASSVVCDLGEAPAQNEVTFCALNWVAGTAGAWPSSYTFTGFTQIGSDLNLGGQADEWGETTLWRKVAGGSESTTYEISWTGGTLDSAAFACVVYSDVDTTTPEGTPATSTDTSVDTTGDIVALTTTEDASLDLAIYGSDGDGDGGGSTLSSWGSSLTERVDQTDTFAHVGIADAIRAMAGVQAATSVTISSATESMSIRVEVFEAVAVATTLQRRRRN